MSRPLFCLNRESWAMMLVVARRPLLSEFMIPEEASTRQASRLVQKSRSSKRHFHEILDESALEVIHRVEASYMQEPCLS